jgi:hypothetical protein
MKRTTPGGWQTLMRILGHCSTIRYLQLHLPSRMADSFVSTMIDAIAIIPRLETLELHGGIQSAPKDCEEGVTRALVSQLNRNTLRSLKVVDFTVSHEPIFEVLSQQSNLEEFDVVSCVDNDEKRSALAEVLLTNTSLRSVRLASRGGSSKTYEVIQYYTCLNRMGRKMARGASTSNRQLVNLLLAIDNSDLASAELAKAGCVFGLLKESPAIWCQSMDT